MPFTPSHAVAILPFARTPLAPAALVIGSMAPDLPYFLPLGITRSQTHSLTGAVTIDLLVAAAAFVLWAAVLRAPVLDYSPGWVRERMARRARWRVGGLPASVAAVIVALVIGILSHLLLDLFTHEGGWLSSVAPVTDDRVGPFVIANYIHATVSVLAATLLALWVRGWARRTPRRERSTIVGGRERVAIWVTLGSLLAVMGVSYLAVRLRAGAIGDLSDLLATSFIRAAGVVGVVAVVIAAVWMVRRYRLRSTATTLPRISA